MLELTKTTAKDTQQRKSFESWVFNIIIVSALIMLLFTSMPFHLFSPDLASALVLIGLLIRLTAIRQLGRFFSVDLGIHGDHKLIQEGWYKMVRHPTYTGALISFFGLTLIFQDLRFNLIFISIVLGAYLWRIKVEEGMLLSKFSAEYADYRVRTKALIPWLI
jgi:protein-S-isoprenylcysteine O-methyltransferase